ncbi:MAG: hypothetical protein OQJ95_04460 [Kangiella sp.]|nr:hypothetical protein [Kangiella sp.]
MSTWNRSYLEAIGLPVWVSRQVPVADIICEQVDAEAKEKAQAEQTSLLSFISVEVSTQAEVYILITSEQNLKQAQSNFQSLKQAWKQWQATEFRLALAQLVEQANATAEAESIDNLTGKKVLLSTTGSIKLADLSVEKAPSLDWQCTDDKKSWWQLLQRLAE